MQEIRPAFHTFKDTCFPFLPSSTPGAQASATKRTRASDLWVFRPSHINVHGACGSVPVNAFTASTKSSSVRVEFRYGISIRPVATSKNPMRLVCHGGYTQTPFWRTGRVMGAYQDIYVPTPVPRSFHPWKQCARLPGFVPGHSGRGRRFRLLSAQKIPGIPSFPKNEASNEFCGDVNLPHF